MSKAKKTTPASKGKSSKELLLEARKRKQTPNIFQGRSSHTPIVFTLEDVRSAIEEQKNQPDETESVDSAPVASKLKAAKKVKNSEQSSWGAASLSDILGFAPTPKKQTHTEVKESEVAKKHLPYYRTLVEMRKRIEEGFNMRTKDHLKNAAENDDSSGYSQHMADAGTDNYDRDLALAIASNEQEELYEIDKAIERILKGSYGICEITGETISKERLEAVPYTRYSLEGQRELEQRRRRNASAAEGIFPESSLEETAKYTEDASD